MIYIHIQYIEYIQYIYIYIYICIYIYKYTFVFTHITSAVKPVHQCTPLWQGTEFLKAVAELCFYRYVHFACVSIYTMFCTCFVHVRYVHVLYRYYTCYNTCSYYSFMVSAQITTSICGVKTKE